MNSKERLLCALSLGRPDRLPVTVHQWQPYHLTHHMGGMSQLEAFKACGMDAAIVCDAIDYDVQTPQWRNRRVRQSVNARGERVEEYRIETPERTLDYSYTFNEYTCWLNNHPLTADEDIYLIEQYLPIPRMRREIVQAAYDELGDAGILRGFLAAFGGQAGPWQEAVEWFGMEHMLLAAYTKPDWVHAFLKILTEKRLAFIERELPGLPYDLVETGGGAGSDTCVSPRIFEQFLIPYDRRIHDAVHALGFKVVYHTCGGMARILDLIPRNGCDAAETLTPPAMGGTIVDCRLVKEELGSRVCLIGGMDQNNILNRQDGAGIRREVRRLFETFGQGGGYILSPCDHFFDVPREKLAVYAREAAACRY